MKWRVLITFLILAAPLLLGLTLSYDVIKVQVTSFMGDQPSVGYREGPRRLPPQGAVPITGVEAPPDKSSPANPVEATSDSLARGHLLFDIHCAVCHGPKAKGDGPVARYYKKSHVEDLTEERIVKQNDGLVYLIITKGFQDVMPSLAENLTPRERWDVINYLRTLQKPN